MTQPTAAELEKWRGIVREEFERHAGDAHWYRELGRLDVATECEAEAASWRSLASFLEQMEGLAGEEVACPVCSEDGVVLSRCTACGEEFYTYEQSMAHSRRYGRENPDADARHQARTGRGLGEPTPTTAPVEVDEERSKT